MKKVLATILIFMVGEIITGYAQIYNKQEPENETAIEQNGYAIYNEASFLDSSNKNADTGGIFRDTPATSPGNRPINGGGIGQEAPLGNGLHVLIACSIIYGVIVFFKMKSKNK